VWRPYWLGRSSHRTLRQEPKPSAGSSWRRPWRTACASASGPFATAFTRGHPRHSHPPARASGSRPEAKSATGHRPTRAPLLRFVPLQRSGPCRPVRVCQAPDDPASVFEPLLRVSAAPPSRLASLCMTARAFATCLPTRARLHRACTTGPPRRWPHRSFIAGFYAADVPDPSWPFARPCRGQRTRGGTHGVRPFAVLLLPAGRGESPSRSTHLPFPECPPRAVFVEGSAAQCCRVTTRPTTGHSPRLLGFPAGKPRPALPALPGRDCPGLCLFQVFGRHQTRRRELVLAPAVGLRVSASGPIRPWAWANSTRRDVNHRGGGRTRLPFGVLERPTPS
jgi:hypothetical protein